jgi:hypothetical protein
MPEENTLKRVSLCYILIRETVSVTRNRAATRQEATMLKLRLSHTPNPDVSGGYWGEKPKENVIVMFVESIKEASVEAQDYIERNELGGGNWTGGQVFSGAEQIARISYNGRAWDMSGKEIQA